MIRMGQTWIKCDSTLNKQSIALSTDGYFYVWEYASRSQAAGTKGCVMLQQKIDLMWANNPKAIFFEVPWEAIQQ